MITEEKDKLVLSLKIVRDSFFGNYDSTKDKQLLLEDLSTRLPYGVKVTTTNPAAEFGVVSGISIKGKISVSTKDADIVFECTEVKPYLRPMSSMTKEEREIVCSMNELSNMELNDRIKFCSTYMQNYTIETFDYLNSIHIDYRGLIEKGLALEAPEGMYN